MGFFDKLGNMTDDQSQGLLAAASQMLQQSGPSSTPTGLGQILGGGYQAYAGATEAARKRKLEEEQARQMAELRGLQIQEAQGGLQSHQAARARAEAIQRGIAGLDRGAQSPALPPEISAAMASAMPGGANSPKVGGPDWMQQYEQQAPAAPAAPAAARQRPNQTEQYANRLMQEAAVYSQNGDFDGADKRYQAAVKLLPQVEKIETAFRDGKPMRVISFKDGTERVSDFDVKPDLAEMDLGGRKQFVDRNQVRSGQSFDKTVSPDTVYSGGITMRGQNMTDARAVEAGQAPEYKQDADGNWLALPKKVGAGGQIVARPVYGADGKLLAAAPKPLTESQGKAALFSSRMDKANQIMERINSGGTNNTSAIKGTLEAVPVVGGALGTAGNFAATDPQQRLEQSQRDFINAVLRQESGAAISPSEFESAAKQYFPQRGDSAGVIAQKAANRATAIQGMSLMSGPGAAKLGVGAQPGGSVRKYNPATRRIE